MAAEMKEIMKTFCSDYEQTVGTRRMRKEENFEQYFIKPQVANFCISTTKQVLQGESFDVVLDPCVGPAHYSNDLKKHFRSAKHIYSDIDPKFEWIEKRDFIENPHYTFRPKSKILTVCNPPFGGLKLSDAFIKNALVFSDAAAFVIPHSYTNHERTYQLTNGDDHWRIIHEVELPENMFTVNGEDFRWKCILQIWKRGTTSRLEMSSTRKASQEQEFPTPNHYEVKSGKKAHSADLWMVTCGKRAGTILEERERKPANPLAIKSPILKSKEMREKVRRLVNVVNTKIPSRGSRTLIHQKDYIPHLNKIFQYVVETNPINSNRIKAY
jgi:hypothetical protein